MAGYARALLAAENAALKPEAAQPQPMDMTAGPVTAVPGLAFGEARAARLTVGSAFDPLEADADRLADQALRRVAGDDGEGDGDAHVVSRSSSAAPTGPIGLEGGALDPATEEQITSRIGSGAKLPQAVRGDMESAFGRSFGNVGIHTDSHAATLNRRMSSTAFTVGTDIFFSAGSYQPEHAGGRRLLAHELAHVAQQAGSARRQVSRAVGFEFETNVVAHQIDDPEKATTKPLPKMYVIKSYAEGFRMEADENTTWGSTIEFVVDPPVEEGNREQLVAIMKKMTEVAAALTSANESKNVAAPTVQLSEIPGAGVSDANVLVSPRKSVQANPQVTGGIAFDKVIDLMTEMGSSGKTNHLGKKDKEAAGELDTVSTSAGDMARRAKEARPPFGLRTKSKQLEGLGALLASYVRFGAAGPGKPPLNYAKLISGALLLRTDFGSVFKKLPDDEKSLLALAPKVFVQWVLQVAGVTTGADVPVFERGVYAKNAPRKGEGADTTLSDAEEVTITRRAWLTEITAGIDKLSSKQFPQYKANLEGLGGIGNKFDAVGPEVSSGGGRSGVVMEFRRMRGNVEHEKWNLLALGIFDYLSGVNARA
ncbi:MAG: DUF4157 domain-containing protein [Actinomycetota bacterium]|nr:DUF4157 domain-containing protein [Actinomycetota bacterium]